MRHGLRVPVVRRPLRSFVARMVTQSPSPPLVHDSPSLPSYSNKARWSPPPHYSRLQSLPHAQPQPQPQQPILLPPAAAAQRAHTFSSVPLLHPHATAAAMIRPTTASVSAFPPIRSSRHSAQSSSSSSAPAPAFHQWLFLLGFALLLSLFFLVFLSTLSPLAPVSASPSMLTHSRSALSLSSLFSPQPVGSFLPPSQPSPSPLLLYSRPAAGRHLDAYQKQKRLKTLWAEEEEVEPGDAADGQDQRSAQGGAGPERAGGEEAEGGREAGGQHTALSCTRAAEGAQAICRRSSGGSGRSSSGSSGGGVSLSAGAAGGEDGDAATAEAQGEQCGAGPADAEIEGWRERESACTTPRSSRGTSCGSGKEGGVPALLRTGRRQRRRGSAR